MILNDDYSVSFRSKANGLFVTADNYGNDSLIANRQLNQGWERFIMTPQPDGSYSLESKANWKFTRRHEVSIARTSSFGCQGSKNAC